MMSPASIIWELGTDDTLLDKCSTRKCLPCNARAISSVMISTMHAKT